MNKKTITKIINTPPIINMSVKIDNITLSNPVLAASGTFGYGQEYASYIDMNKIGGLITKGISLKPRIGNIPPRIHETPCGMLNSIGLANVGLEVFLKNKLPFLAKLKEKGLVIIINIYGESISEFIQIASSFNKVKSMISALEINISCPNIKNGGIFFGEDPKLVAEITRQIVNTVNEIPIWIKLTPNVVNPIAIAEAAFENGAKAVSLINTLLGMAINVRTRRPCLGNGYGGLSGPAIKPIGVRIIHQIAQAIPRANIIGIGGIMSGEDVAEYMLAGARAVQVGTANFTDPRACSRIISELEQFCREENVTNVSELTGSLKNFSC